MFGLHTLGYYDISMLHVTGTAFDLVRYSPHDGPGIRTTVFFKGCPLDCWWCHNPESQSPAPQLVHRSDRCIHCLSCLEACPSHAIVLIDGNPVALNDKCRLSGNCLQVCQSGAREIAGKKIAVASVKPMTVPPATARINPKMTERDNRSRRNSLPASATHSGDVVTRTTELATEVYSSEVIHAAK